jgi:hypothetical protein
MQLKPCSSRVNKFLRTAILPAVFMALAVEISFGQTTRPIVVAAAKESKSQGLPRYLTYRYFLARVDTLDKQATAKGVTNPYQFAESFASHAGLANAELDLLREEARTMIADLKMQDERASVTIAAFRAKAKAAVESGQPLPPIPAEIHNLQRQRTALLVQHFVNLQTALGPATSSRLDEYLAREFTPHVSTKRIAMPRQMSTSNGPFPLSGDLR